MRLISGKPTLFATRRTTALVALCVVIISLGILPPALGRTASISIANRATLMLGFGCIEAVWTTWPDSVPQWSTVAAHSDRTRRGQIEWSPAVKTAHASTGPIHHTLAIPFWILLIPAAGLAALSMRCPSKP